MLQRTISGVGIAVVLFVSVYFSDIPFGVLLLLCSLIAVYELSKAVGIHAKAGLVNALEVVMYIATVVIYSLVYVCDYSDIDKWTLYVLLATLLALMSVYVFTFPKYHCNQVMAAMAIVIYAPLLLSFGYRIRAYAEYQLPMTALIFIIACGSDVFAYFVGTFLGKHKLAPKLSPKKSIEGSVGAIILTGLACFIYASVLSNMSLIDEIYIPYIVVLGFVGSIISQIGDLMASAIKRNFEIKDYGNLIPGHGGIMDRVDSWLVVMPLIYVLLVYLDGLVVWKW